MFDHTSLIRFIEAVFGPRVPGGLTESNITPWRQAVCGDLTTAFNFKTPNAAVVALPSTAAYAPPDGTRQTVGYVPVPPVVQALPGQEPGARRTRAIPYEMHAYGVANATAGTVNITFGTTGAQTAVFLVRAANPLDGQRSYTVGPQRSLLGTWTPGVAPYDLTVSGPNGFVRRFVGNMALGGTGLTVQEVYSKGANAISITMTNGNATAVSVLVTDGYSGATTTRSIAPGASSGLAFKLTATHGWYDLRVTLPYYPSFGVQLAGHLETGVESFTDPLIG